MIKSKNVLIFSLIACFIFTGCSKSSSGGGNTTVQEENLSISIDPDPGTAVAASLGASYDFKINIKSKMPPSGVKIDIDCTRDSDNSSVFTQSLNNSTSSVNVSVGNLVGGVLCTAKITVTSVSKSSNTASLSFKLARK